ncbi:MAG: zinc ABC transporter substrate-binding protein [Proteobacteria bacterium]|nr:zinc ABC transporter substrate-binding protein [Pseudomonadota bacterium]
MYPLCLRILAFFIFILFPTLAFADLKVVATLPTLGALAREIGGSHVSVETLANNAEDPHYVSPRPDFVLKANQADLLIYNGMELEIGWLPPIQKNARNPKILDSGKGILDASRFITPMHVPKGKIDRALGDIHAQGNPHFLYSLPNGIAVAKAIADKMIDLDPQNAGNYQARLNAFLQKAEAENKYWIERFSTLAPEKKKIISYHDSMIYMTTWLGLEQKGTIEPIPGVAPSPSHITTLAAKLKADPVSYILQENYQPKSTSEKLGKLIEAKVIILLPGPSSDQPYLDYIHQTLEAFF